MWISGRIVYIVKDVSDVYNDNIVHCIQRTRSTHCIHCIHCTHCTQCIHCIKCIWCPQRIKCLQGLRCFQVYMMCPQWCLLMHIGVHNCWLVYISVLNIISAHDRLLMYSTVYPCTSILLCISVCVLVYITIYMYVYVYIYMYTDKTN